MRRGPGGGEGDWVPLFVTKDSSEPLLMSINLIQPTPRRGSRFDTDELLQAYACASEGSTSRSSPRSSVSDACRPDSPIHRRPSQMDMGLLAPTIIPIQMTPEPEPSSDEAYSHSPSLQAVTSFVSVTMHRTASATASALASGCANHVRRRSSLTNQQPPLAFSLVDFALPVVGDADHERRWRAKMAMAGGAEGATLQEEEERYAVMLKLLGALVFCGLLIPVAGQWVV